MSGQRRLIISFVNKGVGWRLVRLSSCIVNCQPFPRPFTSLQAGHSLARDMLLGIWYGQTLMLTRAQVNCGDEPILALCARARHQHK